MHAGCSPRIAVSLVCMSIACDATGPLLVNINIIRSNENNWHNEKNNRYNEKNNR